MRRSRARSAVARGGRGFGGGGGGQPALVCALAASLAVSMCGLRSMVGSFLVPCPPRGLLPSSAPPQLVLHHRRGAAARGSGGRRGGILVALERDGVGGAEGAGADDADGGGGARGGGGGGGGLDRGDFVRAVIGGFVAAPAIGGVLVGGGVGGGGGGGAPAAQAAVVDRTRLGTPILTESVLLDLLPIDGAGANVLRAIQDEIEKATILRTLYRRVNYSTTGSVVEQLPVPPSVWDRVQAVAEGALDILMDRRAALEPVFREMDSAEAQIRRAEYFESVFGTAREALTRMAAGARSRLPPAVLSAQEDALLALGRIGELLDAGFPFKIDAGDMYDSIPRLLGRATVEMTVRREPDGPREKAKVLGNVTVVVDGYSSPVTAGNFIDLALRGFYNELPIRFDGVPAEAQVGADNNETISTVVSGSYREGFVDPATGALRRLPLEILRVGRRGNAPVYGAARNTKVFTKAPAVQTFRIPGAIAMNHPALDGNGASSEFFWLQDESLEKDGFLMNQGVEALDGRYAIFAYVVGNRKLLGRLRDGDVIEKVTVTYGEDNLIRPKSASFTDLLLKGGNTDDEE